MPPLNTDWLTILQGVLLGANLIWAVLAMLSLLCVLQLVASVLSWLKRWLWVQWLLRVILLVKSTPLLFFSGLLLVGSWTSPNLEQMSPTAMETGWRYFVVGVTHFAFVPTAAIFVLSLLWIARRALAGLQKR